MKSRGILFSAPMIRALLERRKTQTRRIIHPRPSSAVDLIEWHARTKSWCAWTAGRIERVGESWRCPYGRPGDHLWVRETFTPNYFDDGRTAYRADFDEAQLCGVVEPPKWTPCIYMRQSQSRITLAVTSIRVERLHDLTELDARAEGMPPAWLDESGGDVNAAAPPTYRQGFARGWNEINGKRAPWKANPWLWVVGFSVLDAQLREVAS
jgi:hypothetical protein